MNENAHPEAGLSGDGGRKVLYECDAVVVVGVVAVGSSGGWGDLADGYAVRSFNLLPWKRDDGELNFDPLLVLEKVEYTGTPDEDGEDDDWWDAFWEMCPEAVVRRLTVRISQDQKRSVLVDSHEPKPSDLETLAISDKKTASPTRFESTEFGTLNFDRSSQTYTGTVRWDGAEVKLSLESDANGDVDTSKEFALQLWKKQKQLKQDAEAFATQQLLKRKNEDWLNEGDSEVDANEFKSRLRLESIDVNADGSFQLWYDDGDLFWGHLIVISGGKSGWVNADLQG